MRLKQKKQSKKNKKKPKKSPQKDSIIKEEYHKIASVSDNKDSSSHDEIESNSADTSKELIFSPFEKIKNKIEDFESKKRLYKDAVNTNYDLEFFSKDEIQFIIAQLSINRSSFYNDHLNKVVKKYAEPYIKTPEKYPSNILFLIKLISANLVAELKNFLLLKTYEHFVEPFVKNKSKNIKKLVESLTKITNDNDLRTVLLSYLKLSDIYYLYADSELKGNITKLFQESEKYLLTPPKTTISIWKKTLGDLKKELNKNLSKNIDQNKYDTLIEPVIRSLAKIFLMQPKSFVLAKFSVISICEEILYKNPDNFIRFNLYYHLANFNEHTKHNLWRSSVYSMKLKELLRKVVLDELLSKLKGNSKTLKDITCLSLEDYKEGHRKAKEVQKPGDQTYTGLTKYVGNSHRISLEEEPGFDKGIKFRFNERDEFEIKIYTHEFLNKLLSFSILTGKNGSRKTQILDFIFDKLLRENFESSSKDPLYSLYVESEATMLRKVRGVKSYDFKFEYVHEKLKGYLNFSDWKNRNDIGRSSDDNINTKIAIAIADQYLCKEIINKEELLDQEHWKNLDKTQQKKFSKQVINITEKLLFSENLLQEPITIAENIFKQHLKLVCQQFVDDLFDETQRSKLLSFITKYLENHQKPLLPRGPNKNFIDFVKKHSNLNNAEKSYNEILNDKSINDVFIEFTKHIENNRQEFYTLCSKYCEEIHKITPPNSIISDLVKKYFKGYKINFEWDASYSGGYYIQICKFKPELLSSNVIYVYNDELNNLLFIVKNNIAKNNSDGSSEEGKLYLDDSIKKQILEKIKILANSPRFILSLEDFVESNAVYTSVSDQTKDITGKFRFIFRKYTDPIELYNLSTGELVAIKFIFWAYVSRGLDFSYRTTEIFENPSPSKIKLLLLDEVDKHFDSHLTRTLMSIIREQFTDRCVKVIMTTHKPDTLALVPVSDDSKIFTVQQNGAQTEIVETHKLLAMFRLTGNMKEITGHHHVVYTESRSDALFYEGVYQALMKICDDLRENQKIADWQKQDSWDKDKKKPHLLYLLSKRAQLSFMSVSADKDGSGGCSKVLEYIASDINAYRNRESQEMKTNTFYSDYRLYSSYGILDRDTKDGKDKTYNYKRIAEAELKKIPTLPEAEAVGKKRVAILERHSLESFVFDPFILCSFLKLDELNRFIDETSLPEKYRTFMKGAIKDMNVAISNNENNEKIQNAIEKYFTCWHYNKHYIDSKEKSSVKKDPGESFKEYIESAKKALDDLSIPSDEEVNKAYIEKLQTTFQNNHNKFARSNIKQKLSEIIKSFTTVESPAHQPSNLTDEPLKNPPEELQFDQKIKILIKSRYIEVSYPEVCLFEHGHTFAETLFWHAEVKERKDVAKKITLQVAERTFIGTPFYIPIDLAVSFFELNFNLRNHVREVLKPKQEKLTWKKIINDSTILDNGSDESDPDHYSSSDKETGESLISFASMDKVQSQISLFSRNIESSKTDNKKSTSTTENNHFQLAALSKISKDFPDLVKLDSDGKPQIDSIVQEITDDRIVIKGNGDCLFNSILLAIKLKKIPHANINSHQNLRNIVSLLMLSPNILSESAIFAIQSEVVEDVCRLDGGHEIQYYRLPFQLLLRGLYQQYHDNRKISKSDIEDSINILNYIPEYAYKILQPGSFARDLEISLLLQSPLLDIGILIKDQTGTINDKYKNDKLEDRIITLCYNRRQKEDGTYEDGDHFSLALDGIDLSSILTPQVQVQMCIFQAIHINPLLSIPNLLVVAKKITGSMEAVNRLIALGEESDISEQIIEAINDRGVEEVINLFFTKPGSSQKSISLLLEDSSSQNTPPKQTVSSTAIAGIISLDIVESAPTIKYLVKEIFKLDIELPKISNEAWIATHLVLGATTSLLLETPDYTITDKLIISGINSANYGVRTQLFNSVDKIGLLPTIAIQALLTLANKPMHQIDNKQVLYDIAISAAISGIQYYQYHHSDANKEKTIAETFIPYVLDITTAILAIKGINLPDNNNIISYAFFTKQALMTVSSIVTVDYSSKILLSFVSAQIKEVEDYIYSYFGKADTHAEINSNIAGEINSITLES